MPEKWHCFFVKHKESNKYNMKYDFSTYILNKLNEAGEEKKPAKKHIIVNDENHKKMVYISPDANEKEIYNFIKNHLDDIEVTEDEKTKKEKLEYNGM